MRPTPANGPRHATTIVVACTLALVAACNGGTPEEHMARGKAMAEKEDHAGATVEFKNALQGRPKSGEARFLLGRELLAQGAARAAEIELQRAYDARYDRDVVVPMLIKSQMAQGQPERISPQVVGVELKTPAANAELQSLLGTAALMQGNSDDAVRAYRSAQQYMSGYAPAVLGEARVRATRGDLDGASAQVASVLAQDPKDVEGLILKGDIAQTRGALPEAIQSYQVAVQVNPKNIVARQNLASAYLATGARDLAIEQVTALKKIAPRAGGVNYLDALISFDKKDYLHANEAVSLSLAENPANGAAQILAGAVSLAMNQPVQGELHLLEGVRVTQGSVFARRLLADLYLHQRQPQKAYDILQPAVVAFPNDPLLVGMAGEIALQQGDFQSAAKLFERASAIDPDDANLRVRGAAVALARGDEARGIAALETAAKASANNPSPKVALVIARLSHQQYDEALTAWADLERQQPDNPVTYNLRAAIDLGRHDLPAARKALEHALKIQSDFFPVVANLAALDEAEGNVDAARQRYRTLLAQDRGNVLALVALAQLEANHGAGPDTVVPLLQEARRANPGSEQPVQALVAYYQSHEQPQQALATAQEALAASPNNIAWLALVGDLQMQRNGIDQALGTYKQLVMLRPDVPRFQIRLGQAMVMANQTAAALQAFGAALAKDPDSSANQAAMVTTLLRADKLDDAQRLLAAIRKVSPKSPALPELDGDVKLSSKQYADAAVIYKRVLTQSASSELAVKTSLALRLGGSVPAANGVLADWLKTHPKDTVVLAYDGDVALQAKDYERAVQRYRAALAERPTDALLMNNLAWALYPTDADGAFDMAQKAGGVAPDNPAVGDTLGWMMVQRGDTKRGIDLLQKAATGAPTQHEIALHLAKAQIKDGRKEAARTTLQGLVRAAPTSPEAQESRSLMATL